MTTATATNPKPLTMEHPTSTAEQPQQESALQLWLKAQLVLPLLFKNDCATLDLLQDSGTEAIECVIYGIMKEVNKKWEQELSAILQTRLVQLSPSSLDKESFCLTLK
jgi:hypothetical protein